MKLLGLIKVFLSNLNKFLFEFYNTKLEDTFLRQIISKRIAKKIFFDRHELLCKSNINIKPFFIATSKKGLLVQDINGIYQLSSNCSCFGLTKAGKNTLYVFVKKMRHGSIHRIIMDGTRICFDEVVYFGLSLGIHQVLYQENSLYVIDTYNNALIKFCDVDKDKNLFWMSADKLVFYPSGILEQGRSSTNYKHYNSIASLNKQLVLLAHNETSKTQKNSELHFLDKNFQLEKSIELDGSNCHDIYCDKFSNQVIYCASLEGEVKTLSGESLHKTSGFTRGIFKSTPNTIVVGVSPYEPDRASRGCMNSYIDIIGPDGSINLPINNTQIHYLLQSDDYESHDEAIKESN